MRTGQIRGGQVREKQQCGGHGVVFVVSDGQLGHSLGLAALLVVGMICCVRLPLRCQANSDVAKAGPVGGQSFLDRFFGCEPAQQHQRVKSPSYQTPSEYSS